jgi:hypothetical protein
MPAQEAFPNGDAARVSTENSIAPAASAGASGTVPQPGEAQDSALKIQRPEMLQSGEAPAPPIIAQNALTSVPAEPDPDVDPEDTRAPPVQHYRGSAEPKGDGVDALPAIVEQSAAVSPTSAEPPTIADFREAAVALVRAFQRIDVELSGRHRKLLERVDGINPQGTTTSLAQMARSGGRYVADNQRDLEEARDFLVAEASLNGRLTISRDAAIEVLRMYERPQRPMDWALNNKIIEHGGAAAAAAAINQDISVLRGAIQRVLEPMARRLQAAARDLT